jgi:hypothetical protein
LEFIKDERVQEKWTSFWPRSGNAQNWDALGKVHRDQFDEWLLVEAKGHLGEIKSSCGATRPSSKQKITRALESTSVAFGNRTQPVENWQKNYYQYANRLAVLHFLTNLCVPAVETRLLFVYFYGEIRDDAECPQNKREWEPAIGEMNDWLGIDENCELSKRVHKLYLPVNPLIE